MASIGTWPCWELRKIISGPGWMKTLLLPSKQVTSNLLLCFTLNYTEIIYAERLFFKYLFSICSCPWVLGSFSSSLGWLNSLILKSLLKKLQAIEVASHSWLAILICTNIKYISRLKWFGKFKLRKCCGSIVLITILTLVLAADS